MRQPIFILLLILISMTGIGQQTISGKIKDNKGRPLASVSISIRGSYDGGTSDSTGAFSFKTTEKGVQTVTASSIGYNPFEQSVTLNGDVFIINIALKEEPNELKAVVVTAGTFEAGDSKRTTVLTSLDVVTTASANGDVVGAIKTLPGTQQVGEKEGLFIRGGSGEEAKIFIDGTVVNNFFFSNVPDIGSRGRFSPFLFKGTVFSSGGYSALYGQALSGALILETIDLPEQSSANIGISTVGLSAGYQQLAKNKKSSWGLNYNYTNISPYFKLVKQAPDYFKVPVFHSGDGNFRIKTSRTGIIKFYGYFNASDLGLRRHDIDSAVLKNAFSINNLNVYGNLSWKEKLGKRWKLNMGASYSNNIDKIANELQDQHNIQQQLFTVPYDTKSFNLRSTMDLAQVKAVFERRLKGISAIRFGGEYLHSKDRTIYNNKYVNNGISDVSDNLAAGFAEADIYVTNDLAAKAGIRAEHSSILGKANLAPRFSLAYKIGQGQFSAAYGIFYQKPERNYLLFSNNFQYQQASHYILNYQKVSREYTIRAEVFYKKYNDLIKTFPDTSNAGSGEAKGLEIFWRDKKTFKGVDYWVSYSYLDTKRDYLNYPRALQPNFAANHTASLVIKKFITSWKMQFNGSYTFTTGRPYYNFMYNSAGNKYSITDQGKTINYNNLSLSVNYLPDIGKTNAKKFVVWVLSVTNVLGNNTVYNYNYSYNGQRKEAVTPPARRFIFIGCFISFGVDRSDEVINSNL
ncbi:MAG: TonB-dependent receptor [Chitinophagaceae bacterium]